MIRATVSREEFVDLARNMLADARRAHRLPNLDDAAGELANMVAGRVAARLAAEGYPCDLGNPSVSRHTPPRVAGAAPTGVDQGRADLFNEGHWLSVEIDCRFANV